MNYEVKFKRESVSFRFIGTLKDLDTQSETVIRAPTLTDLLSMVQQSVLAHERIKAERLKVPLSKFDGKWKFKVKKGSRALRRAVG